MSTQTMANAITHQQPQTALDRAARDTSSIKAFGRSIATGLVNEARRQNRSNAGGEQHQDNAVNVQFATQAYVSADSNNPQASVLVCLEIPNIGRVCVNV